MNKTPIFDIKAAAGILTAAYSFDATKARFTATNINDALEKMDKVNKLVQKVIHFEYIPHNEPLDYYLIDTYFCQIELLLADITREVHKEITSYYDERGAVLKEYMRARQVMVDSILKAIQTTNPSK